MRGSFGFSLVELLVSISIVAVMLGVGIPAFRAYGQKAELGQAATDIQVALLQAHNLALAPESDKPVVVDYYGVQFYESEGLSKFKLIRGVKGVGCPTSPEVIEDHTLPAGISLTSDSLGCSGYLVGTGASPVVPANYAVTLHSSRAARDSNLQRISINPVTGQVTLDRATAQ
jgi:prepilin-type N-terminal cleavage/methylation domain-containing protein